MKEWSNRENLKGKDLSVMVKEVDGFEDFGIFDFQESVSYPVTGMDVVNALEIIRDKGLINTFKNLRDLPSMEYILKVTLPIENKSKYGRATPKISARFMTNDGNSFYCDLEHKYGDSPEKILTFRDF